MEQSYTTDIFKCQPSNDLIPGSDLGILVLGCFNWLPVLARSTFVVFVTAASNDCFFAREARETQARTNIHYFAVCPAPDALTTRTSAYIKKAPVDRIPAHVVFQSYGNTWDAAKI